MATTVLLRLAAWTGEAQYREAAERALATVGPYLARYPTGFAQWLIAATLAAASIDEVAVVGPPDDPLTLELLRPAWSTWRPEQVLALAPDAAAATASAVPLLHDRVAVDGRPTAYVCHGFTCRLPVTDPAALAAELG
jgi:uncharacterized protein YyaL (SSP411 family)